MCDTCGCNDHEHSFSVVKPEKEKHIQQRDHKHNKERKVEVEINVLHKNNLLAERNRGYFEAKNIMALNLVSSPGSGKTTLLENTIKELKKTSSISVIEGDQQTTNDAERIALTGVPVIQINTGNGCHLDAHMINHALQDLKVENNSVLMIENVGNLVCPAMFDLGEKYRIVIVSVTEGEDKPLKYPYMFTTSHICIINKTDLLPYLDFDLEKLKSNALHVNHHLKFFELSAKNGDGLQDWIQWINKNISKK